MTLSAIAETLMLYPDYKSDTLKLEKDSYTPVCVILTSSLFLITL